MSFSMRYVCVLVFFSFGFCATTLYAQNESECLGVIRLGRTSNETVRSKDEFHREASNFCEDYRKYKATGNKGSFSGGYKGIEVGASSSKQKIESTSRSYCSSEEGEGAKADAFEEYLSYLPDYVVAAYNSCIEFQGKNILFDMVNMSIRPEELMIPVSFKTDEKNAQAELTNFASTGVTCSWNRNESTPKDIVLEGDSQASLVCNRSSRNERHDVIIMRTDGIGGTIKIPWMAHDPDGLPVDFVRALEEKHQSSIERHEQLLSSLQGVIVPFEAADCPNGWSEYTPARGRFIRGINRDTTENKIDPDGIRKPGSLQDDSFEKHTHQSGVASNQRGFPDGSRGTGRNQYENESYWRGPVSLSQVTGQSGESETRPKNVALLYCQLAN